MSSAMQLDSVDDHERKMNSKLIEMEECNEEIGYYKSICIPNSDDALEINRLQDIE